MSAIRSVCVYCGSSDGADARFGEAAEELGRTLAADGVGLVYGGGGEGLMGRLARSTLAGGGYVTGIIPSFLIRKEHPLTAVQEMLVVEDMHERKQAMFHRADAEQPPPGGSALWKSGRAADLAQLTPYEADPHPRYRRLRPLCRAFAHMLLQGFSRRLRGALSVAEK